jgi:hypothetical protein
MNQRDYSLLVSNIGEYLSVFNQILYEILIVIVLYNFFYRITFKNISRHKPFIILFILFCIFLDWFIWKNYIQTALFGSILFIYTSYNYNNNIQLETFINTIKTERRENALNDALKRNKLAELKAIEHQTQAELEKITYIPPVVAPRCEPASFDEYLPDRLGSKYDVNIKEGEKQVITDTKYAQTMLDALYESPQYKAIKPQCSDPMLDNDIHTSLEKVIDINEFRNPKKEFLDNDWLKSNDYRYNDNCESCVAKKSKNAICTVVEFGNQLSECTDQEGKVSKVQLDKISNNNLKPIY